MAILFSIMNSCKLNDVGPREHLAYVVKELHEGREAPTPREYSLLGQRKEGPNTS